MSEQELYERYLQERQWNYTSWEDYKKMWESKTGERITTSPAAPHNDGFIVKG